MDRRAFLGLATGMAAGLLVGCGDDDVVGGEAETDSTSTGTSPSTTASTSSQATTGSTDPDGTGSDSTGEDSGETTDTGEEVCEPGGFEESFDAEAVPQDDEAFPLAIMAGEMKPTSAMFSTWLPDGQTRLLRIWRPAAEQGSVIVAAELEVTPDAAGFVEVSV
jgi:hypothetical protein